MIRRPPRSTLSSSSAASDVYKRQLHKACVLGHYRIVHPHTAPPESTPPGSTPSSMPPPEEFETEEVNDSDNKREANGGLCTHCGKYVHSDGGFACAFMGNAGISCPATHIHVFCVEEHYKTVHHDVPYIMMATFSPSDGLRRDEMSLPASSVPPPRAPTDARRGIPQGDSVTPIAWKSILSKKPVSYTHLTLPTKRIV